MDSISRVSSLLEPTRDLTLDASTLTSSLRKAPNTSGTTQTSIPQIKTLLNSKHDREILDGLRRFLTLTQSPKRRADSDVASQLLPTILKNISSPNTHIRKLVYLILIQHAESDQDTALLAINSIQKALSASDPHIRALALRTISSLRVPVIAQIVALGIKKGIGDMSPIVRKTAALAIPKCWKLDPSTAPQLEGYLGQLLGDRQYIVVGAACTALLETELFDTQEGMDKVIGMMHGVYRGLCKKLVDMDDWGQCAALRVLGMYARRCFPIRTRKVKKDAVKHERAEQQRMQAFYDEPEPASELSISDEYEAVPLQDPDLTHLFKCSQPLLQSRNPAVIVAVTRLYIALEVPTSSRNSQQPPPHLSLAIPQVLTLLRGTSTPSIVPLALHNILQVAHLHPSSFVPHTRHFILKSTDSPTDTAPLKVELLALFFPHAPKHTQSLILSELATAARRRVNTSPELLHAAISAIGRCALAVQSDSPISTRCLQLLLSHVKASPAFGCSPELSDIAASEALTQVRHLIQASSDKHMSTVIRLAKDLDTTKPPKARAAIVWLVGEYAGSDMSDGAGKGNVAADVLRILLKGFADEAEEVKIQISILAAKVYVHHLNAQPTSSVANENDNTNAKSADEQPRAEDSETADKSPIPLLYAYLHSLIRYDTSYHLRDIARTHRALLPPVGLSTTAHLYQPLAPSMAANTQLATLLLLAPKPPPVSTTSASLRQELELGSAALVLGDATIPGYDKTVLPKWVKEGEEPDARLRDAAGSDTSAIPSLSGFGSGSKGFGTGTAGDGLSAEKESRSGEVRVGAPVVRERDLEDWLGEDEKGSEDEESGDGEDSEESSEEEEEEEETDEETESDDDDGEEERLVR
ncbi:MAG: hypothetical protein Q9159_002616 [Coniocarpon cinnabarinum]